MHRRRFTRDSRLGLVVVLASGIFILIALSALLPSTGAQQANQDLHTRIRDRRLTTQRIYGLGQGQKTDSGKGWLLDDDVFRRLSSAGQLAVLKANGGIGHSSQKAPHDRATFGQNLRVNDPAFDQCGATQSESSITAQGPNVVVGFNDTGDCSGSVSSYAISTDKGKTFTENHLPTVPGGFNLGDPTVAFGPSGELYYGTIAFDSSFNAFVGVARSLDGGAHFGVPVNASTTLVNSTDFQDKPWMTVDQRSGSPFRGNVYASWTDFTTQGDFIAFARSTDGGQTFSTPVHVTPLINGTFAVQGSVPVVAFNGSVYVAFLNDFVGGISVVKSSDGGQSFGTPVTAAQFGNIGMLTGGGDVRTNNFPSMAIDSTGNIHIVFNAIPDLFNFFALDRSDVFYVRSEDGGQTFTSPLRLNDDNTNTSQWQPDIAVTDDGSVGVKWWDRRNDPTHDGLTDVYMTVSNDGGRTFGKNFRITDSNWAFGPIGPFLNGGYHGDYDAMAGGPNRFLLSWSDERNSDPDVFFSSQPVLMNHDLPDFNLSAGKLFDSVIAGDSVTFQLTTKGFNNFSGLLQLAAVPAINGITFRFSPQVVSPGGPSTLIIETDPATAPGTYLVSVSAAGRGIARRTDLRLTVFPHDRQPSVPVNVSDTSGFTSIFSGSGLQVDSQGTVHLVYDDDSAVPDVGDQVFYKASFDNGVTFSPAKLLSTNSPVGFAPSLAIGSTGNVYVVWTSINASFTREQIFFAKSLDGGANFSAPVPISPPSQIADQSSIVVDGSGKILVIYQNFANANTPIFAVQSTDNGVSFSAPVLVSLPTNRVNRGIRPYAAFDSSGAAYVVYNAIDSGHPRIILATAADGIHFTAIKTISNISIPAFAPHIAVDVHDNLYVVFTNVFAATGEVMFFKSTDHGLSFSSQQNLSNNVNDSGPSFVIVDAVGHVTVSWQDTTLEGQSDILVAESTNGGASFDSPLNLSANSGSSFLPSGAANPVGPTFVCWVDDSPANPDVFIVRIPF